MANITVTQSCYWGDSTYNWAGLAYGNTVTVENNATLTIDPSQYAPTNFELGVKLVSTAGFSTIRLVNTSNSTPLLHYGSTAGKSYVRNGSRLLVEGGYIEIGTGDGTANQVITGWTTAGFSPADEPAAVEVETATAGVYETYINLTSAFAMSVIGVGELGKWFLYNTTTGTLTFGDNGASAAGKGGCIIPSGRKIRVYNIGFGTKDSGGNKVINATLSNDYTYDSLDGGVVTVDKCYFFGFYPYLNKYGTAAFSNIASVRGFNIYQSKGGSLSNVSVCHDKYGGSNPALTLNGSVSTEVSNCKFARGNTGSNYQTISFVYGCQDNYFSYCESYFISRASASCYTINISSTGTGCEFENLKSVGASITGGAPRVSFKDVSFSDSCNGTAVGNYYREPIYMTANDATVDGFTMISDGTVSGTNGLSGVATVLNCSVSSATGYGFSTPNLATMTVARCLFTGVTSGLVFSNASSLPYRLVMQNVRSSAYVGSAYLYSYCPSNTIYKGVDVGSTPIETATGAGVVNTHFAELFQSATTGVMAVIFTPKTDDNNDYETSGTVTLVNGYLYILSNGGSITFTYPHWILTQTGFPSGGTVFHDGSGDSNFTYQYDIDTGSGFSGSFSTLNHTNLSAHNTAITANGKFRFKVKISRTTGSISEYVRRLYWSTTVDRTILYPLSTYSLILQNVKDGSVVVVENVDTSSTIYDGQQSGTGDIVITGIPYNGTNETLRVTVRKASAAPYYIPTESIVIANGADKTAYISQVEA